MAPDLRDRYDLSLTEIGVVLAAEWIGLTVAMLPWGFAADGTANAPRSPSVSSAARASSPRRLRSRLPHAGGVAHARGCGRGGPVRKRARGDAVVRRARARARTRGSPAPPSRSEASSRRSSCLCSTARGKGFSSSPHSSSRVRSPAPSCSARVRSRSCPRQPRWRRRSRHRLPASLRHQRRLRRRPGRPDGVHRPLPARGARSLGRSRGRRLAVSRVVAAALRIGVGRWSDVTGSRTRPLRDIGLAMTVRSLSSPSRRVRPGAWPRSCWWPRRRCRWPGTGSRSRWRPS